MYTPCKLQYAKGTCPVEATSNSEKIKPVALVVIELGLVEDNQTKKTLLNKNSVITCLKCFRMP